jgi:hypothetical protein
VARDRRGFHVRAVAPELHRRKLVYPVLAAACEGRWGRPSPRRSLGMLNIESVWPCGHGSRYTDRYSRTNIANKPSRPNICAHGYLGSWEAILLEACKGLIGGVNIGRL